MCYLPLAPPPTELSEHTLGWGLEKALLCLAAGSRVGPGRVTFIRAGWYFRLLSPVKTVFQEKSLTMSAVPQGV